ncbi:hypothetical protein EBME_0160 [bacterium endosymbiont of Mortierella elongata FMR23-6]|nr:hypothetical protein EBME_0160 [bacterium endosymbiont of Mortierella elongata FMR23-6]
MFLLGFKQILALKIHYFRSAKKRAVKPIKGLNRLFTG